MTVHVTRYFDACQYMRGVLQGIRGGHRPNKSTSDPSYQGTTEGYRIEIGFYSSRESLFRKLKRIPAYHFFKRAIHIAQ